MNTNEFFKHRSVTACMKASYDSISGNIKNLLRKTWWAVLPQAFLTAIFLYIRMPNKGLHDWGEESPMASFILQSIIYLLLLFSTCLTGTALWSWINKKSFSKNLCKYLAVIVCTCAILVAYSAVTIAIYIAVAKLIGTVAWAIIAVGIVLFILSLVITLPFAYIIPRYMLLEKGEKLSPWKSYKCGLRHSGSFFKLGFLGYLLLLCICFLLSLPMNILIGVQFFSQMGALDGDPIGVPGYFPALFITVETIILFLIIYLSYWLLLSFTYLYGSIENDEKEKKELKSINIKEQAK